MDAPRSCLIAALLVGCGSQVDDGGPSGPRFAEDVVRFAPGAFAGFGADDMPDVVLGPPGGTFDIVSLGVGGEIVLGFGATEIVDGPGPDFVVFENPFFIGGDPAFPFAEPARVSVSEDGVNFADFPCAETDAPMHPGCAGVTPLGTIAEQGPLDPVQSGGDAFDLADLGLERALFVRLVDTSTSGEGTTAGFDLDAIGLVHFAPL